MTPTEPAVSWWTRFRDRHCDAVDFILGDRGGVLPGIWPLLIPLLALLLLVVIL